MALTSYCELYRQRLFGVVQCMVDLNLKEVTSHHFGDAVNKCISTVTPPLPLSVSSSSRYCLGSSSPRIFQSDSFPVHLSTGGNLQQKPCERISLQRPSRPRVWQLFQQRVNSRRRPCLLFSVASFPAFSAKEPWSAVAFPAATVAVAASGVGAGVWPLLW